LSASSPQAFYDWTFHYELSRPVFCKESVDGNTIKFEKEGNNLKGFNIVINNETESKARKTSELKAKNLVRILIIMSGMEIEASLTGEQGVPKKAGLIRVGKTLTIKYGIEGWIDKIDITDPNKGNLINQDMNPDLVYLSKAVAHKYHRRYSESITEAFRIIDEEKSVKHYSKFVADYNKYQCIRNILSHREGQRLHKNTMKYFTQYFDPIRDAFDFKHYDDNNRIVILDSESTKTQQTLEHVARDLISAVRSLLKL
jgi:hypothetical protein